MKHVTKRLVLAFYPQQASASQALAALRKRGWLSSAVIDRSASDSPRISRNGLSMPAQSLVPVLAAAAVSVALLFAFERVWLSAIGASAAFVAALLLVIGRYSGISDSWIERYQPYVFSGETLLLVEVPSFEVRSVFGVLRESVLPAVFVLHSPPPIRLDDTGWPREEVLMSAKQVRAFAADLGLKHQDIPLSPHSQHILEDLRAAEGDLEALSRDLLDSVGLEQPMPPAAEWLYDNFHLIRTEIAEIRRNLPKRYYRELPAFAAGEDAGSLRILCLAEKLVSGVDNRLNLETIIDTLESYQSACPLTIAELWAFPIMWRMAMVEELRRLSHIVAASQRHRELAQFWADRLRQAARKGPDILAQVLAGMSAERTDVAPGLVARLSEQLHDEEATLVAVQRWFEQELQASLTDVIRDEHNRQARTTISISNAIGSIRQLGHIDYQTVFEKVSFVEELLKSDPAEIYVTTSFETRDRCRRAVEEIARLSSLQELRVTQLALQLAEEGESVLTRHVGYYLLDKGVPVLEAKAGCRRPLGQRVHRFAQRHATVCYLGAIALLTLGLTLFAINLTVFSGSRSLILIVALALLACLPASELAIRIVNSIVVSLIPPWFLPKKSFESGIPPESATLVVVPMMLLTQDSIRTEVERLEVRYLANPDERIYYSLLSDYTDATEAEMAEDGELLATAVEGVERLNQRYPGERFLLFHRPRRWSVVENRWIGWERKRGKIEELNAYLCGEGSPYNPFLYVGRLPEEIQFVITLDSDTQLPAGTARKLIETISHPLNRIELSPDGRSRERGYTIIQPRVSITLPGTTATRFTQLFTNMSGTDPYCQAVSDVYQDLFGEGIFLGKAIYDVRSFHRLMSRRFPEEQLLSHDLIEGAHVGVALASDIELFENFPYDYYSHSRRQHRWVRGDWQIADWILRHVPGPDGRRDPNPLSLISRWKIFDNLRRSLVPVASLTLLIICWLASAAPVVWSGFVGFALAFPAILDALDRKLMKLRRSPRAVAAPGNEITRVAATVALLPHQAWLGVDAIVRVAYRRWVSQRHLLEWETSQNTHSSSHLYFDQLFAQMRLIRLLSIALAVYLVFRDAIGLTSPFVGLWIMSPELLRWIHRPKWRPGRSGITLDDRVFLRATARRTWRYFDDLVGLESNWLPPDNSQEALRVEVAQRTSPTNIGMWLTSAVAAYDFGYLTPEQLVGRCSSTLATMDKLERHKGHLLNWYNTLTLEPLTPRYVSTVDSGNLIACLWVLEASLRELLTKPLLSSSALRGLADTLNVARTTVEPDAQTNMSFQTLASLFERRAPAVGVAERIRLAAVPSHQLSESLRWRLSESEERAYWLTRLDQQIGAWTNIIERYLRWMELLAAPPKEFVAVLGADALKWRRSALRLSPSLRGLAQEENAPIKALLALRHKPEVRLKPQKVWLDELAEEFSRAQANAEKFVAGVEDLIIKTVGLCDEINLRPLYDPARRLFVIGYRVGEPLDKSSHYDLLASECRLTSLVAIARGEVPLSHWLALGRPCVDIDGKLVLLSWHGTMFEYLMPNLFNFVYENSLLDNACRAAVQLQVEYGDDQGIPWGISESAFAALDANQTYQYKGNGVPDLGLKRGLEDDQIVSPYSTMLALQVDNQRSIQNLRRLQELGMVGRMGFYEAVDYTRQSSRRGAVGVMVYCFMAHHQGMSLMALDNTLNRSAIQKRFHSNPRVRAIQSLLYEGLPAQQTRLTRPPEELAGVRFVAETQTPTHRVMTENTAFPRVNLLGNGRYSLIVTNSGGGCSRWMDFELTRWRADTTRDNWGSFLYLRDERSGRIWSTAYHPIGDDTGRSTANFSVDRVEFFSRSQGIDCLVEITVSPADDAEVRRVTLTNRTLRPRYLELTSYSEISLAPHAADRTHPAFSKMFVETEILDELDAVVAGRRPRAPDDSSPWVGEVTSGPPSTGPVGYETDRSTFIGRANSPASPAGLTRVLNGSSGTVLDPVFALRRRVQLQVGERVQIAFVTVAGKSREEVVALIEKYRSAEACNHAFELAWTHAQLELRYLGIQLETAHHFQELASHLLYPNFRMRAQLDRLKRNVLTQSRLWAHGISGDLPIATVSVADFGGIPLVRETLLFHTFCRLRGVLADLVILNQEAHSYDQPLREQLLKLVQAHSLHTGTNVPGGVFLLNWNQMPADELNLLLASANVVLGPSGTLLQHLSRRVSAQDSLIRPLLAAGVESDTSLPAPLEPRELAFANGIGGFSVDGREYSIALTAGKTTPLPWINVIANSSFGSLVTESGNGMTWSGNSQNNRLTPWHNDPFSDAVAEALYLRDEETGSVWTPTPRPIREQSPYRITHGAGYTLFEHNSHGIEQTLLTFVPMKESGGDPIRIDRLRLRNTTLRKRRLSVTAFSEWTLGRDRETAQRFVVTEWDSSSNALFARNSSHPETGADVAFAALTPAAQAYSADRTSFLGRNRSYARPAALDQQQLSMRCGAGLDPCAALQTVIELERGQEKEIVYLFGQAASPDRARDLLMKYRDSPAVEEAYRETCANWDRILGVVRVATPAHSVDLLLNRWLLYQTLSCRMWARSAFYQSGGAYGFRDQLQDALALVYCAPDLAREHILRAASRQFVEGDVQHWWQPASGEGIRSRCSDDLLWLPYAAHQYVRVTGDTAALAVKIHFIEGPALKPEDHDAYFVPSQSPESASLFEHCRRAVDRALTSGPHGLPLIGTGDWNDGMNLVGKAGRGESIWLAFFLVDVLQRFSELCEMSGKPSLAADYRGRRDRLETAVEHFGWDGDWYLRAYFDDGTPLGSKTSPEAKIDSLPQSWSVISRGPYSNRSIRAMEAVHKILVRERDHMVLLFDPPFAESPNHPGYIQGYPPGVRENGGQYTHAALWVAQAMARLGDADDAVRILQMLNPIERSKTPEDIERYKGEPYAVAADVYALPGRVGRCGWSWYTGSAGLSYRIWIEDVLGLQVQADQLSLFPTLPSDWPGYTLTYRYRSTEYEITVENVPAPGIEETMEVDGKRIHGRTVHLIDDGATHRVRLQLGTAAVDASPTLTRQQGVQGRGNPIRS